MNSSMHQQSGTALMFALLMVVSLSFVAVASMRDALLQQRLAQAALDRRLAGVAAEELLAAIERNLLNAEREDDLQQMVTTGVTDSNIPLDCSGFSLADQIAISRWKHMGDESSRFLLLRLPSFCTPPQVEPHTGTRHVVDHFVAIVNAEGPDAVGEVRIAAAYRKEWHQ